MGQIAAREQPGTGPVDTHGLVTFVLYRKGMAIANPAMNRILVQLNTFLEVFSGNLFKCILRIFLSYSNRHRRRNRPGDDSDNFRLNCVHNSTFHPYS